MALDITKVKASVDKLKAETAAALGRISEDIAFLKKKAEEGGGITQTDLDMLATSIDEVAATLSGTDPLPDNPTKP